jgi:hypothetical protein
MSNIQNNRFTILFGASNKQNVAVSPSLVARGINMLRLAVNQVPIEAFPEVSQAGYGFYKSFLPHFMSSYFENTRVSTKDPYILLPPVTPDDFPEFGLPPVIFSYTHAVAEEVRDNWREKHSAQDVLAMGKPAQVIVDPTFDLIRDLRASHAYTTTPALVNTSNISCFGTVVLVNRIMTLFLSLHQYPAFCDDEHFDNYQDWLVEKEINKGKGKAAVVPMVVEDQPEETSQRPESDSQLYSQEHIQVGTGSSLLPYAKSKISFESNEDLPYGGLWFPFLSDLANFDTTTVPSVIARYFKGCLGDGPEEAALNLERIRADFGILGRTEWGKIMSHIFAVIRLAIESQGVCRLVKDKSAFEGCVLMGAKFMIHVFDVNYYPGNAEQLNDAVRLFGSNRLLLAQIASKCKVKGAETKKAFEQCERMWLLRKMVNSHGLLEGTRQEILELAVQLRFQKDRTWQPNVGDISRAKTYLVDSISLEDYSEEEDLPIGGQMLFETDKEAVIWSCFGQIAPSFRIPGGVKMDLRRPLQTVVPTVGRRGEGGAKSTAVTAVSIRMVPIKTAVDDLKAMRSDFCILNPFGRPNVKRSAPNAAKLISGRQSEQLVAVLRELCRVGTGEAGSSKRKEREDDVVDKPAKKRSLFDF